MNYSLPYLLFVTLLMMLTVMERVGKRNRATVRYTHYGCIILYLLFIGLRGYIGTDWYNYRIIFEQIPTLFSGQWEEFRSGNFQEIGFLVFATAVKSLWNDYHFFVFLNACLDMVILHVFLNRYVSWYTLGFLLFFIMGGLTLCELVRNSRSVGLFLLSIRYVIERRPIPYVTLNLVGMSFHLSSLIYILLYGFIRRPWPRWLFVWVFLLGNVVFLFRLEIVRPLLEQWGEAVGGRLQLYLVQYVGHELYDVPYGWSIGYVERIFTGLIVLVFYRRLMVGKGFHTPFLNLYLFYFAAFFFLSEMRELAARTSLLFVCSYWVLVPEIYEILLSRFKRAVFRWVLYGYCLLKMAGMTAIPLYRYDNLLWGVQRYEERVGGIRTLLPESITMNPKNIHIAELSMTGPLHAGVNTGFIQIWKHLYPRSRCRFFAEKEHVANCSERAAGADVLYCPFPVFPRAVKRTLPWRDLLGGVYGLWLLLRTRKADVLFITNLLPVTHWIIVALNRWLRRKVYIALHGQLEALLPDTSLRSTKYYFRLHLPLLRRDRQNRYIVLGEPVYQGVKSFFPEILPPIVIDHPYDYGPQVPAAPFAPPLRLGQLGIGNRSKGTEKLFRLGILLRQEIEAGKVEIHLIGRLDPELLPQTNRWVNWQKEFVSQESMDRKLHALHYTLLLRDETQGRATASGSFFDTVRSVTPFLSLGSSFVRSYADRFPGCGEIFDSLEQMATAIRQICRRFDRISYGLQMEQVYRMQQELSTGKIARRLQSQIRL
ncbi:MAG: EpsG family protein [Rikenellaceae bacterium]|nr:EpsG family protein [Rikenellaceae bacterium]